MQESTVDANQYSNKSHDVLVESDGRLCDALSKRACDSLD